MLELVQNYGLIGLFAASFLAATVVPLSSEFALTGVLLAGVNPFYAFFVATAGNWLGGITSYYIGYLGRWDLIEKWFGVKEESLFKQKEKIQKYGSLIAFFTWLPIIGDLFAIGLGFYRIDFVKSSIFMLLGRSMRFAGWVLLFVLYGERAFHYFIG